MARKPNYQFERMERDRQKAIKTAEMCTKTSLPPSSGWMKPKPLVGLNHFTVPIAMFVVFLL